MKQKNAFTYRALRTRSMGKSKTTVRTVRFVFLTREDIKINPNCPKAVNEQSKQAQHKR